MSDESRKGDKVWFYEIKNDGFDPDKITGGVRPETPKENDIPAMLEQWKVYKDSEFQESPGGEAGAMLEPGSEAPECWWAPVKAIVENDYNLAAGRYKPHVADEAPQEAPAELIREVLDIEKEITNGLKTLLKQVDSTE